MNLKDYALWLLAAMLYEPDERAKAEEVVLRMVRRAIEMEGQVSGEHGVGIVKRDFLLLMSKELQPWLRRDRYGFAHCQGLLGSLLGPLLYQVKKAFDPLLFG